MNHTIQVRQGESGQWYWRVVAGNNKIILTSEVYASMRNAERAAYNFWTDHKDFAVELDLEL